MFIIRTLLLICSIGIAQIGLAQKTGSLKGIISSAETRQAIVGATVYLENVQPPQGSSTNAEGEFLIQNIVAGRYNVAVSMMGYKKFYWEGVNIMPGQITVVHFILEEESEELERVTVVTERNTQTEEYLIKEIKEAQVISTGISAEQISKNLDTDAGQALRRLPGVSLIEDRFILVRGLGERYNNVLLNGALAPNTEVDTRSFSFDLIPANAIDRMLIIKTGSAELPGDFAGAIIKVFTKNVPSNNFLNVSGQLGYRIGTTGNQLLTYQGSPTDWLGYDNGFRKLPGGFPAQIPKQFSNGGSGNEQNVQRAVEATKQLNNVWLATPYTAPPDFKVNLDLGRRWDLGNLRVGNLTTLTYQRSRQYTEVEQNSYELPNRNLPKREQGETYFLNQNSDINTRIGILHNWSLAFNEHHKIQFRNLFNQLSRDRTTFRTGYNQNLGSNIQSYQLFYESRSIYSGQLTGEHKLSPNTTLQWLGGTNYINRWQPDLRRYILIQANSQDEFTVFPSLEASISQNSRFFSKLFENTYNGSIDIEHKIPTNGTKKVTLKAGFFYETKQRDFNARWFSLSRSFIFNTTDYGSVTPTLENAFDPKTYASDGFYLIEGSEPTDSYQGNSTLMAFYGQAGFSLGERIELVTGLRWESSDQILKNSFIKPEGESTTPFDGLLPSINLSYEFAKDVLLRAAYFRSWNRPEFREIAPFSFYDFDNDWNIAGFEASSQAESEDLKAPVINNAELRLEWYPSVGEMISFGGFYKHFNAPIEIFLLSTNSVTDLLYRNAKSAKSWGLELEIRKNILLNPQATKLISVNANAAYIRNSVNTSNLVDINQTSGRRMYNQSPYVINTNIFLENTIFKYKLGMAYNIFGARLTYAADKNGNLLDMYELPRHELDLVMIKDLSKRIEMKIGVQNFLNAPIRFYQDSNTDGKINTSIDEARFFFRRGQNLTFTLTGKF